MTFDGLPGKPVIVTGSGQGIGRSIASSLAGQGARVVVADINAASAEAVAAEIVAAGGQAVAAAADVSDRESADALVRLTVDAFGGVEGVVNNAAIFSSLKMRAFDEIDPAEWDAVHAVNLRGTWTVVAAAAESLRAAGKRASVVNISAGAVWMGRAGYAHYVSSKSGVIGLTRVLARELGGYGVRVNAVAPGPVSTEIGRETITAEQQAKITQDQCIHRGATPMDLVGPIAFLLSDHAEFVTGQSLNVDGGLVLN